MNQCLQVFFSLLVQSSEGATYGVVPFVSKRSLGVVSGFVGAGGNAGSVIVQALFFTGTKYEVRAPFQCAEAHATGSCRTYSNEARTISVCPQDTIALHEAGI